MPSYTRFLEIYGLKCLFCRKNIFDQNNEKEIELKNVVINVDKDFNIEKKVTEEKSSIIKRSFVKIPSNILYFVFVLIAISWHFIYSIYKAIEEKEMRYITSNIFTFLFIMQFFLGIIYYQKSHFTKTIKRYKSYTIYIIIAFITMLMITIIICIASLVLLISGININIYSEIYQDLNITGKIFLGIALLIDNFYSYNIFFSNLIIFSVIFVSHSIEIKKYTERLEEYVNNNEEELTIESIIKDYSELKTQHTFSVSNLNNIFSSITILGILSGYFIMINFGTKFVGILHFIEFICFVITESVYILSISRVKMYVSDITTLINSPAFVSRFLSRIELEEYISGANIDLKSSKSNAIVGTLKEVNVDNNDDDDKKIKIDIVKDLSIKNMIINHENADNLDWLILNDKLKGSWENFNLFGFEIDDSTLLKKTIAISAGIIMLLHLNNSVTF